MTASAARPTQLRSAPVLFRLDGLFPLPGWWPGGRQPMLVAGITLYRHEVPRVRLDILDAVLRQSLPACREPAADGRWWDEALAGQALLRRLAAGVRGLMEAARVPVFEPARLLGSRRAGASATGFQLALPALGHDARDHVMLDAALRWVLALADCVLAGDPPDAVLARLDAVRNELRAHGPQGFNTVAFLRAADTLRVPWHRVTHNVFQFGWGARARWLDSSFTDATPVIGAQLARHKVDSAAVLRRGGIPVPDHALARDAEHAAALARRLGYPVVVKPADLDGGAGVAADLRREEAVRTAYAAARALSAQVLVEKHVPGEDYRLQVYQDTVFWAVHRVPGGVTGDGRRTVAALLEALNADPRRGERGSGQVLQRIAWDEEARALVAEQGLAPQDVPQAGRFVRLRRAANVGNGGVPVPVLEEAHPDNLALAVRAARLLRLDLAGVDLIMPDIRRSWMQTGAAICEVNAQPQLSPHLPEYLLPRLVPAGGRVPVAMIVGSAPGTDAIPGQDGPGPGPGMGVASARGAWLDGQALCGPTPHTQAVRMLLADPRLRALFIMADTEEALGIGPGVDRLDALWLVGPLQAASPSAQDWDRWVIAVQRWRTPDRPVHVMQGAVEWQEALQRAGVPASILPEPPCLAAMLPIESEQPARREVVREGSDRPQGRT